MAMPGSVPRLPSASIFIGNVGFSTTEEDLKVLFSQAGPLKSFRLVTDRDTGKTKGFAFAEYFDVATAQSAQRHLNGTELGGRPLRIDFADTEKDHKAGFQQSKGPDRNVGREAIQDAEQGVAAVLGGPGGSGQQQISEALSKMTRTQIYEIMAQMKALIQQNPAQARQILVQNPQLTKALFQAQILLGMISVPVEQPQGSAEPSPQSLDHSQAPGIQHDQPPNQAGFPQQHLVAGPSPQHFGPQNPQIAGPQAPNLQSQGMQGPMGGQPGIPNQGALPSGSQPMHPGQGSYPGSMQTQPGQYQPPPGQYHPGPAPQQQGQQGQPFQQQGFPPQIQGQPGPFPMHSGPQTTFPQQGLQPQGVGQPQYQGPMQSQPGGMQGSMGPHDPRMMTQQAPFDPRQPQPLPHDPRHQGPHDPRQGGLPHMHDPHQQSMMDPRHQQPSHDPRQQAPQDPRQGMPGIQQGFNPHDPRQNPQGGGDPRQQARLNSDPRLQTHQQTQPTGQLQGQPPNLGPTEQQALLRQVMNLTPQQIDGLPEAQKQQVLELQRQLRSQVGLAV